MPRKTKDDVHRPITRNEVETAFETLLSRFVEADRHVGQEERDEARLMYVAERCVKTVLDLLKLTADALVKLSDPNRKLKPFIVKLNRGATTEDVDAPLTSVLAGGNHHALVQAKPFIAKMRSHATAGSIDEPLTTVTAHTVHHAVVTPFLVNNFEHNRPKSIDEPLPTLTTGNHVMKVTPLICDHQNHGKAEPPDRPMRTVSTHDHFSLATLVLGQHSGSECRPDSAPMPTVCTRCCARSITPLIVDNANGGGASSGAGTSRSTRSRRRTTTCCTCRCSRTGGGWTS